MNVTAGSLESLPPLFLFKIVQALSPANGAIVSNTATPTLKWAAFPGAVSYSVVIYNSQPELVFSQTTGNTQITISPPLPPGTYNWGVFASDATYQIAFVGNDYFTSCYVHVVPTYVGAAEKAAFVAPNIAVPPAPATTALEYARACGFAGFDWVQIVTTDLTSPPITAGPPPGVPVSPIPGYHDPPPGGYTYQFGFQYPYWLTYLPNFAAASPFYFSPKDISPGTYALAGCGQWVQIPNYGCLQYIMSDDYTLNFYDVAQDPSCPTAPGSPCLAFETQLVGICDGQSPVCGSSGPSPPLYHWTWATNYNGTSGGISGQTRSNFFPPDPGSGTGGVTITSINGVQLPPVVLPNLVATTASGLAYSRVSQTFNGTVTVENISGSAISGPLQMVFFGMPANVTLVDATGDLSGTPYLTVPALASLAPGQSATVSVQFKNPSNATINFTPAIYSGSIN